MPIYKLFQRFGLIFSVLVCASGLQAAPTTQGMAQQAFARFGPSIYQVRIINIKSQNLNSSGSGFYVGGANLFATNYHVVASVALEPDDYKVIIRRNHEEIELQLAAIDVVNDLALLHVPVPGEPLQLRDVPPAKGEKLYSVGNPHNIGMTIVEGNYNGLADDYVFDRIHFSGALNPGMSGGPTIDNSGHVVGVNVQTGGNQVGFLVPVEKLKALISKAEEHRAEADAQATANLAEPLGSLAAEAESDESGQDKKNIWHERIAEQVAQATGRLTDEILSIHWPQETMTEAIVPGKIHPGFQCWGNSEEDEKKKVLKISKGCNSRQSIYISHNLTTGYFEYEFHILEGEDWPDTAFYRYASSHFSHGGAANTVNEKDVDNFTCIDNVIRHDDGQMTRKAAFCVRPYKKLKGLTDVFYMAITVEKRDKVLMEHYSLVGVTESKNREFMERFIGQARWQ